MSGLADLRLPPLPEERTLETMEPGALAKEISALSNGASVVITLSPRAAGRVVAILNLREILGVKVVD